MALSQFYNTNLPPNLRVLKDEIEGYAREMGLDFYETIFEVITADDLNQIAAYGGFPTRYPHWSFGMQYEELKRSYEYGLSKIYEMVINNDPCYAYLMRFNHVVDQKLVMAHVYGHCDFFKHNAFFAHTNRKMMDEIANHGSRIRKYVERFGEDEVEAFLDRCQSIDDLIDIHSVAIQRKDHPNPVQFRPATDDEAEEARPLKFRSKAYLDEFMNPRKRGDDDSPTPVQIDVPSFPDQPTKDVLQFLIEHAPLKHWQRDILSIVRDEAYYFYPQGQTKIMNEGWACIAHTNIMTKKALHPSEVIDYADHHSGTVATSGGRLNPYKLGLELMRDIEWRWDTGRFGPEWDDCDNAEARRNWNKPTGLGRQKIFEVRKVFNDITFIDSFLTPEFCRQHKLFSFNYQKQTKNYVVESREFEQVKQRLLNSLTNFGKPWIEVINGNHRNRGELLLRHRYEGVELKRSEAQDTLVNLCKIWGRPVHLESIIDDKPAVLSFDGQDHTAQVIGGEHEPKRPPARRP